MDMSRYAVASYLEAEVKCYHCGHTSGVLRRMQSSPNAPTVFQSADGTPAVVVRSLTDLHCQRCQGSVFTDEFETRYVYPKVDFLDEDRPRRGRPPKRLVELRRAREEAEAARKSA
jgi:hypothetical protein